MSEYINHHCGLILNEAFTFDLCAEILTQRNDVETFGEHNLKVVLPGTFSDVEIVYFAPKDRHSDYVEGVVCVIFGGQKLTLKTNNQKHISDLWLKANDVRIESDAHVISEFRRYLIGICNNNNVKIYA